MEMAHTLAKPQQVENCENLFWLRGSGKFSLHGLSVVYLSGKQPPGPLFGTYSQDNVDALRASMGEPGIIELFLTNEWPSGVTNGAALFDMSSQISDETGADSTISELVAEMKPRYHIAGTKDIYYAREPYSNVDAVHVIRLLGLASVENRDRQVGGLLVLFVEPKCRIASEKITTVR